MDTSAGDTLRHWDCDMAVEAAHVKMKALQGPPDRASGYIDRYCETHHANMSLDKPYNMREYEATLITQDFPFERRQTLLANRATQLDEYIDDTTRAMRGDCQNEMCVAFRRNTITVLDGRQTDTEDAQKEQSKLEHQVEILEEVVRARQQLIDVWHKTIDDQKKIIHDLESDVKGLREKSAADKESWRNRFQQERNTYEEERAVYQEDNQTLQDSADAAHQREAEKSREAAALRDLNGGLQRELKQSRIRINEVEAVVKGTERKTRRGRGARSSTPAELGRVVGSRVARHRA